MKKTPYLTLLLSCAIILVGCIDDPDLDTPEAMPVIVVNDSLYVHYYSTKPQDEFSVSDGELTGDILRLTASFIGGYEEHEFELIAYTGIIKTNPPIGTLFLAHDARADTCRAEISEVLLFDLTLYKEHLKSSGLLESGMIRLPITNGSGQFLARFEYCF